MLMSAEEESACLAEEGKVVNYQEGYASNAKIGEGVNSDSRGHVGKDCDLERMRTLSKLKRDC